MTEPGQPGGIGLTERGPPRTHVVTTPAVTADPKKAPLEKLDAAIIAARPTRRYRAAAFQGYVLIASVVFVGLAAVARSIPYFSIDLTITRAVQSYHGVGFDRLMFGMSWLGFYPQTLILCVLIVSVLFFAGLRWEAVGALFAAAAAGVTTLVKLLVDRPRPSVDLVNVIREISMSGFPSGHVLTFTTMCGFLAFLAYTLLKPSWGRTALIVAVFLIVILMGFSRIYQGHHWFSDVMGGYLLGSLWLALTITFYRWGKQRFFTHQPVAPEIPATAIVHDTGSTARDAAGSAWVGGFMRFGQFVRGVIYVVLGTLALRLALGARGAEMTETGVIELIGQQRFGDVLLVVVAIGLASYALWGVIRAVFDPLRKGRSLLGIAKRIGFAVSGLVYAGLVVVTLGFIVGPLSQIPQSGDWTTRLLAKPFGAWLVGFIGVCWIAAAGIQIVKGWRGKFVRDLDLDRRAPAERRWAIRLGRVGIVTRGIVLTIIGIFLVATAFDANPHHTAGMDGALLGLLRHPFGQTLLGAAGLGLIAYGVFSAMCARWMRIDVAGSASRSRVPSSS